MRCILEYFLHLGRASEYNVQSLRKTEHVSFSEQSHADDEVEQMGEAGSGSQIDSRDTLRDGTSLSSNTNASTNGTPRSLVGTALQVVLSLVLR